MKNFLIFTIMFFLVQNSFCQVPTHSCNQPGALLSVKNSYRSHLEYIVFTFVDPYNYKGEVHKINDASFIQMPLNHSNKMNGKEFYKIIFPNTTVICDTKNYTVVPQKLVRDVKLFEQKGGSISYIIGLTKGAKITSHTVTNYHGFQIIKLRIE